MVALYLTILTPTVDLNNSINIDSISEIPFKIVIPTIAKIQPAKKLIKLSPSLYIL